MTVNIKHTNGLRHGTFSINGIKGSIPSQAITQINLDHAEQADEPNLDFGTKFLELLEIEPDKLNNKNYRKNIVKEFRQIIKKHHDKLCLLGIKGLKSGFGVDKEKNEFLIKFQIECGFKLIKVFFRHNEKTLDDFKYFRNLIQTKKKTFVACIDENMSSEIFELFYSECLNQDDIVSFFGRRPNPDNVDNFDFIKNSPNDNIIRFSTSISKTNKNMSNSVIYNIAGFDCFSFSHRKPYKSPYGKLAALEGLYFNTLTADTPLICVLTGENLYTASQKFKENQDFEYLPIYIHDMVRLNDLLRELHVLYTRRTLIGEFGERII